MYPGCIVLLTTEWMREYLWIEHYSVCSSWRETPGHRRQTGSPLLQVASRHAEFTGAGGGDHTARHLPGARKLLQQNFAPHHYPDPPCISCPPFIHLPDTWQTCLTAPSHLGVQFQTFCQSSLTCRIYLFHGVFFSKNIVHCDVLSYGDFLLATWDMLQFSRICKPTTNGSNISHLCGMKRIFVSFREGWWLWARSTWLCGLTPVRTTWHVDWHL